MRTAHGNYRADIDGLRAVSVVAVILFHADYGVPGGFVGVDVFFVISGYLITRLIAADLDRGVFSLARFWDRRIRRIWPASLAMTMVVLAVAYVLMLPKDLRSVASDAVANVAMLANFRYWHITNYFVVASDLRPLIHTWSLAVEEQFYVLFPLVMMGAKLVFGSLCPACYGELRGERLCHPRKTDGRFFPSSVSGLGAARRRDTRPRGAWRSATRNGSAVEWDSLDSRGSGCDRAHHDRRALLSV